MSSTFSALIIIKNVTGIGKLSKCMLLWVNVSDPARKIFIFLQLLYLLSCPPQQTRSWLILHVSYLFIALCISFRIPGVSCKGCIQSCLRYTLENAKRNRKHIYYPTCFIPWRGHLLIHELFFFLFQRKSLTLKYIFNYLEQCNRSRQLNASSRFQPVLQESIRRQRSASV